jgi:squalene-hopene/tetraprenyl-beta-curcumene cyclase
MGAYKRRDGSPNDRNAPSDGYGTGLAVFVLRQAGLSADHDAVRKGAEWLRREQRASGRWWTRSLNNDGAHYISNAGTAFAVMALRACEPAGRSAGAE